MYVLFVILRALCVVRCLLFVVRRLLVVVGCLLLIVGRHPLFVVCCELPVVCGVLLAGWFKAFGCLLYAA